MIKVPFSRILIFVLPLGLALSLYFFIQSTAFQSNVDNLIIGVTLDLLITIPILYYFLIRNRPEISNVTVLSVAVVCMIATGFILPIENQELYQTIKHFAVPVLELSIFGIVFFKVRKVIKAFKSNNQQDYDFYEVLNMACKETFPSKLGDVLLMEISVLYYSFSRAKKLRKEHEFTYTKKNGIKSMVYVFMGLIVVETVAMHLFVGSYYEVLAWVLTFLSLYTLIQVFALTRSMDKRLIEVDYKKNNLELRYGFFNRATIPFSSLVSVEKNKRSLPEDKSIVEFSALGMLDSHNVIIKLDSEQMLYRLYGIKKNFSAIALYVDEVDEFVEKLNDILHIGLES